MPRKGSNKDSGEGIREEARATQGQGGSRMQTGMSDGSDNNLIAGRGNGGSAGNGGGRQIFSSEEIAERAYQIFEREGRTDGRDMDHWLQAEQELRREREQRGGPNANAMNAENSPRSARQHQQQR